MVVLAQRICLERDENFAGIDRKSDRRSVVTSKRNERRSSRSSDFTRVSLDSIAVSDFFQQVYLFHGARRRQKLLAVARPVTNRSVHRNFSSPGLHAAESSVNEAAAFPREKIQLCAEQIRERLPARCS